PYFDLIAVAGDDGAYPIITAEANRIEFYSDIDNDGARELEMPLGKYIEHVQSLDIGEIYLNSMDRDGTGFGYDFETIGEIVDAVRLPLIIAGGAGNESHLIDGLHMGGVSAVATANLFNFIGDGLPKARNKIIESGENVAKWNKSF
ncbi:MAG: putative imidazoleglycerol-phosphate synthase HisF, partial [Candidatus Gottesmanbacteria bacterium GW2011_GWC2_39_8]